MQILLEKEVKESKNFIAEYQLIDGSYRGCILPQDMRIYRRKEHICKSAGAFEELNIINVLLITVQFCLLYERLFAFRTLGNLFAFDSDGKRWRQSPIRFQANVLNETATKHFVPCHNYQAIVYGKSFRRLMAYAGD